MSHLILEIPKSYQQVSIVLQTGVTESLKNLNWMSSAFWFLVVFHAIKVERNQKKKRRKEGKDENSEKPILFSAVPSSWQHQELSTPETEKVK